VRQQEAVAGRHLPLRCKQCAGQEVRRRQQGCVSEAVWRQRYLPWPLPLQVAEVCRRPGVALSAFLPVSGFFSTVAFCCRGCAHGLVCFAPTTFQEFCPSPGRCIPPPPEVRVWRWCRGRQRQVSPTPSLEVFSFLLCRRWF